MTTLPEPRPGLVIRYDYLCRALVGEIRRRRLRVVPRRTPRAGDPSSLRGPESVRFFSFEIVIEKEPEGAGYLACSPSLPGCFSNGATIEQTRRNMREAITQHVTALPERGKLVPQKRAPGVCRGAGDRHSLMPRHPDPQGRRFLGG
jgi:predicted RNase H-like HicB family nuclease